MSYRSPRSGRTSERRGFAARLLVPMLAPALVAVVAVPLGLGELSRQDAEHARFYDAGASIKGFLGDYCAALEVSHASGDLTALSAYYADSFQASGRGAWSFRAAGREGGATILDLTEPAGRGLDKSARLTELEDYLGNLSSIRETACKISLIEDVVLDQQATLTVRFVLDGTNPKGQLLQDRHFYRWTLTWSSAGGSSPAPGWKVISDQLVSGSRTLGQGEFVPLDLARAGIDYRHARDAKLDRDRFSADLKFDVIQHAAGGLSVADFNLDGRPDLFFPDGRSSRLYKHLGLDTDGQPRFSDVTSEAGLDGIDQAHSALFFDYDSDGDRDLFVARYLAPSKLFENDGGRFLDVSHSTGIDLVAPASSSTLLDFDRDGDLDLYIGAYGNAFAESPRLPFYATNGGGNILLRNENGERFTDVTGDSGTGDTGWTLAVSAADYDDDGWPDLGVANDFGRKTLYRNNGDGTFSDATKQAGVLDFSGGMGLAFGDYNDDGTIDLYTSNIQSNTRWFGEERTIQQYLRNVLRTRWAILDFAQFRELYGLVGDEWRRLGQQVGEGNSVFRNRGDGSFAEVSGTAAAVAGWSWGVAFLDYDNDTDLDLYAANGWISAKPHTDL